MSYIPKESDMHHFAIGGNFVVDIPLREQLRSPLGRAALNPIRRFDMDNPFHSRMSGADVEAWLHSQARAQAIDARLAKFVPPNEIAQHKGDLSWSAWIQLDPAKGGMSRIQQSELLEWNLEEMKRRNRTEGAALEQRIDAFGRSLNEAVADDRIDPALQQEWREVQPHLTAIVKPPLTLHALPGHAHQKHRLFLVDRVDDITIDHEITHLLCGVQIKAANEPITDILAQAITKAPKNISEIGSNYVFADLHLMDLLVEADMNTKTLSKYIAGENARRSQKRLQQALQTSTGYDVLEGYLRNMQREELYIARHTSGVGESSRFLLASARVLQQARGITTTEVASLIPEYYPGSTRHIADFLGDLYKPTPQIWDLGYPPGPI